MTQEAEMEVETPPATPPAVLSETYIITPRDAEVYNMN
jgi:hypothetical protein